MRQMKKLLRGVSVAGCLVLLLCGCHTAQPAEDRPALVTADELDSQLQGNDTFVEVERNGSLALYVKGTTAEIMVRDLKSGEVWYSNPQNRGEAADAASKQLGSQVDFSIYDEVQTLTNKNTVSDAIAYGQVSYAKIEDGVRVTYVMGKKPTVYVIPTAISVERFENVILKNLSEETREYVRKRYELIDLDEIDSSNLRNEKLKKYPALAKHPVYILNENLADFVKGKLQEYILQSGYTLNDLDVDHTENGIADGELPLMVTVPLEYTLDGDSLVVTLNTQYLDVPADANITELSLLRYFGAADAQEEGYILLPDGSGSLIDLNNGKSHLPTLKLPVYGEDLTKTQEEKPASELPVSLPVYGLKQGQQAFLAVIESGDAVASLEAGVSGQVNAYNFVYPTFELTQQVTIASTFEGENDMLLFQKDPFDQPLRLRYFFLTGEEADYTGMAHRYRSYLLDTGALTPVAEQTPALYLNLLGSTSYTDTFLGIPVEKEQSLTTYSQAQEIVNALHGLGVERMVVNYLYWANGGSETTAMDKLKVQKNLGGRDGLLMLSDALKTAGDRLFVTLDLQYVRDNSLFDGYVGLWHAPKTILEERTGKTVYSPATLEADGRLDTLSPRRYAHMAQSAQKQLQALGLTGVNPGELSHDLYSDHDRSSPIDRQKAVTLVQEAISVFSSGKQVVLVQAPNAYALAGVSAVISLPTQANNYYLCDRSVPFYQIVLHGILPYAGEAVNLSGSYQESLLQSAETGSSLLFQLMYEPNHVLYKTRLQEHSACYTAWLETAAADWKSLSALLGQVQGSAIADHRVLSDTVRCTAYENGVTVYVNYGEQAVSVEGVTVKPQSFAVKGVGE